jgi:predicted pyridoxine 5'-phosphate oxidase superfamily flavin-nucleotide-binding protein
MASAWHAGEIALQTAAGVATRMAEVGPRVLRDHLIDQHRDFYPQLPFVVLGAVDPDGAPWATLRAGFPGFARAPDAHHLHLALPPEAGDPAGAGLADGAPVGLLGIELPTRRRNRLNGRLIRTADGFDIAVVQSFGNCPKYIQTRHLDLVRDPSAAASPAPEILTVLDDALHTQTARADTFFVASYADTDSGRQVDVSHRGGAAGFVRVGADGTLTVPDFAGNFFFNTLGNFAVNPKAGLVFPDFTTGDLLQLTGKVELDLSPAKDYAAALRTWRFWPRRIVRRRDALPLRATFGEWSPQSLNAGAWPS